MATVLLVRLLLSFFILVLPRQVLLPIAQLRNRQFSARQWYFIVCIPGHLHTVRLLIWFSPHLVHVIRMTCQVMEETSLVHRLQSSKG
ncbi:hypothetical protein GGR52DRAFT_528175 [Hypoxylon sp. FL1284]|nr:hypothetical protein GGR52DRAFT_528175 [Hypoxylon sp. FL1284]